ncbi:MAG: DsbE family thiol:disulfide interchange protein [Gammaproteobacteria bacterium]|nr:DsbE family thiol:disulfide interchange protein [Gammaproteobacteria bacterium]
MNRARLFGPLLGFATLAVVLYLGFSLRDPHLLPSALLDQPFPPFDLPVLGSSGRATQADLKGEVRLVNVWATWCPTCLAEHDELKRIRETGLSVVGINYKDDSADAVAWLARHGDPYAFSVVDTDGDLGVDLGVYGAPETFLLDADAVIRYKHVGAVDETIWREEIAPAIEAIR